MEKLLDINETAKLLNVKVWTLRQWCSQRRIPFIRVAGHLVRFSERELEAWVESCRVEENTWEGNEKARWIGSKDVKKMTTKSLQPAPKKQARIMTIADKY